MPEKIDIGDVSDLADGDLIPCKAGDKEIALCRVAGMLYALEDLCSHADTTLSDGLLSGYKVTCPLHGAQFDVRDGTHSGPPAYEGVACFKVEEVDGHAILEMPDPEAKRDDGYGPGGYFQTR